MPDQDIRPGHFPRSEERIEIGGHVGRTPRHRDGIVAAQLLGIEDGARPIIGAHPREAGDRRQYRRASLDRRAPDLGVVAEFGLENHRRPAGAMTLEVRPPAAPDVHEPAEVAGRGSAGARLRRLGPVNAGGRAAPQEECRDGEAISGVGCVVARDLVMRDGDLTEATDDWYASAKDGNVWYCGEEVKDFESFAGDDPRRPELVDIGGCFKAGRDGTRPGIIFLASPTPGAVYLEEASLANAEDVTVVPSTTYAFGNDPARPARSAAARRALLHRRLRRDQELLPARAGHLRAQVLRAGNRVFLEVEPDEDNVSQLVSCNFDPRCEGLPTP